MKIFSALSATLNKLWQSSLMENLPMMSRVAGEVNFIFVFIFCEINYLDFTDTFIQLPGCSSCSSREGKYVWLKEFITELIILTGFRGQRGGFT